MKRLIITASAFTLLAVPVLAQSSKSGSEAASQAAARASGGFTGGNSFTNNFGGSRIPNNTPDVIVSPGSVSGSDCQLPGFALGGAIIGNGGALSIPGGTDEECKALTLAAFYAKLANSVTDAREARQYRQTSVALTCQVPRMKALPLCATAAPPAPPAPPAHYAPTVMPVTYAAPTTAVPAAQPYAYSYADLKATPWYCDNPAGYYPAVSLCSAWRQVQR